MVGSRHRLAASLIWYQHPSCWQAALLLLQVRARENRHNSWRIRRVGNVNVLNLRVCVWTANQSNVQQARQTQVVDVPPLTSDQRRVFNAFDRCAYQVGRCHVYLPPILADACLTAPTMLWYPVHRHKFPRSPDLISSSDGFGFRSNI